MSEKAQVRSIPALREFKAALALFREDASSSIDMMLMELHRAIDWIEHDRPAYWQNETRKAFELVASTRTALNTCLMRTVAGRRSSCIEEKQAHAAAKRRLQHCQEQIERVRRWTIKIRQEIDEFRSRLSVLRRRLDADVPNSILMLDRMATALEAYAGLGADIPLPDPQQQADKEA
ncbi:hypothetical protein Pan44_21600 [Caulifigura coniformis]|uniref:Chromosome partition protein Smc n=1 Tax=Caulifigura coniformis TaxID=2527983 RepID=A0A517SDD2_9PLAN|nr:hypothetical protein [Caulifigura coniformis]QDT54133.1 hypothetical protein Pan44_21600 [Caulifigura coniformis]